MYRNPIIEVNFWSKTIISMRTNDFARSDRTNHLKNWKDETASRFLSLVAIPRNSEFGFDFDKFGLLLNHPTANGVRGIGIPDASFPQTWFSLADLGGSHYSRTDYVLYSQIRVSQNSNSPSTDKYLRFTVDGAIEYVDSTVSHQVESRYIYQFIPVLGIAWKFIHMISSVYRYFKFEGTFQYLVNLVNTRN